MSDAHAQRTMAYGVVFYLMSLCTCCDGIAACKKLQNARILSSDQWYDIHAKFHEFPSSHSLVIKIV